MRILLKKKPGGGVELPDAELELDVAASGDTETESADLSFTDTDDTDLSAIDLGDSAETATSFTGEITSISDAGAQLAAICRFLREQDAEDPSPYLMLRSFAWGKLLVNAPLIDHTSLEAPPSEARVSLKRFAADSDWDQVLATTEEGMSQPWGRTWLDLQRFTVNALEQKGSPATARVVRDSLKNLLEGVGDLLDLTLPDDTPAANAETKNWIENFVKRQYGPPITLLTDSADASTDSTSDSDPYASLDDTPTDDTSLDLTSDSSMDSVEATPEPEEIPPIVVDTDPPILTAEEAPPSDLSDEFQAAIAAVQAGQTADGLSIINKLMATERSGRARFRRRSQLAHLLLAAGQPKVAQPLLSLIASEIEIRHLEDWEEGEALAYPLDLLLRCTSPSDKERRSELFDKICRLDPVRAVNSSL